MDQTEEFKTKLEALLEEYGFYLTTGDMGAEIDLHKGIKLLGYWEISVPGKWTSS